MKLTLGDRLRLARRGAGYTQLGLANALGIALNSVSRYETGQIEPKVRIVQAWAAETGVDLDWLVNEGAVA